MNADDEEFQEFLEIFQEESLERLVAISRALEALSTDDGERDAHMDAVDRELHTIKGSARLLGFSALAVLVHEMESLARAFRAGTVDLDLLIEATDRLTGLVEEASAQGTDVTDAGLLARIKAAASGEAQPAAQAEPPQAALEPPADDLAPPTVVAPMKVIRGQRPLLSVEDVTATARMRREPESEKAMLTTGRFRAEDEVVRVKSSRLVELDEIVSELTLARQRLETYETRLRTMLRGVDDGSADAADVSSNLRRILQDFRTDTLQVQNATSGLQRLAVDVRLRPVAHLFDHVPREVRDLARRLGKKVRIRIRGEETEMDRVILDALKSPLSHLLRNALDHGIEAPAQRESRGKEGQGTLEVSAGQEGNRVVIRVRDDGAGIDADRIRQIAASRGVIDPSMAQQLDDEDALQLIFAPGFSTKSVTTDISGRGIGMDAVRRCVEELKGDVRVSSDPGAGSEVTIRLPLTLLISRVMLVRSGGQRFALPTNAVEESLRLESTRIAEFGGRQTTVWRNQTIPIVRLAGILGQQLLPDPDHLRMLIVHHAGERLALVVEELLEERSVVVKPLGWPLERLPWISGAVHTPSGEIALQLHVPEMFAELRGRVDPGLHAGGPAEGVRRTILVVDDSIVSRQLVGRAVESLGFNPVIAVDGMDAWGILERVRPELIITDIEMPRLDGLGLVRRIRSRPSLAGIPIIIVSNRGSAQDRQAGLEAGADGYLTKSEFSQGSLHDVIERMML